MILIDINMPEMDGYETYSQIVGAAEDAAASEFRDLQPALLTEILSGGVTDGGEAVGMEADKFPSEDKLLLHITSLVCNHLGGEFSPYVRLALHSLDWDTVFSVD